LQGPPGSRRSLDSVGAGLEEKPNVASELLLGRIAPEPSEGTFLYTILPVAATYQRIGARMIILSTTLLIRWLSQPGQGGAYHPRPMQDSGVSFLWKDSRLDHGPLAIALA
jgi:hypothetical protein